MPYIATEEVRAKRKALKEALPEYKVGITRTGRGTGVCVTIKAGPVPLLPEGEKYRQVYRHGIDKNYEGEALRVLKTALEIAAAGMTGGWRDVDYGYIPGHYVAIEIGNWERPYVVR